MYFYCRLPNYMIPVDKSKPKGYHGQTYVRAEEYEKLLDKIRDMEIARERGRKFAKTGKI